MILSAKNEIDSEIAEDSAIINKESVKARSDALVIKYFYCRKKYRGEDRECTFALRDDIYSAIKHIGYLVAINTKLVDAYEALRYC